MPTTPTILEISQLLESVIDPEAGINIVAMGLIYDIRIEPDGVHVQMTMTSPLCPVGDLLIEEITACLRQRIPLPSQINVDLTFEPPWSPDMMSAEAKKEFGW